jgi:thioredoxin reductase
MKLEGQLPVAVIGAGPVGLAAAAHLLKLGFEPIIFERGSEAGANIREWEHVLLFTPWRSLIDSEAKALLQQDGWTAPDPSGLPSGRVYIRDYIEPLSRTPQISKRLRFNSTVVGISRLNQDKLKGQTRISHPFVVRVSNEDGSEQTVLASAVIDASGTWSTPNPLGSDGMPAIGERQNSDRVWYGIPNVLGEEKHRYAGKKCLIIGAGYSAANVALDLVRLKQDVPETEIVWAIRGTSLSQLVRDHGEGPPSRIALGRAVLKAQEAEQIDLITEFRVGELLRQGDQLTVSNATRGQSNRIENVDEIVCTTGQRPNLEMLRELRTDIDTGLECVSGLRSLVDPAVHSCYSAPPHGWRELEHPEEPGFYVVGMKSYGRTPTFLTITGYQQVTSITLALAGKTAAADNVALDTSIALADTETVEAALRQGA